MSMLLPRLPREEASSFGIEDARDIFLLLWDILDAMASDEPYDASQTRIDVAASVTTSSKTPPSKLISMLHLEEAEPDDQPRVTEVLADGHAIVTARLPDAPRLAILLQDMKRESVGTPASIGGLFADMLKNREIGITDGRVNLLPAGVSRLEKAIASGSAPLAESRRFTMMSREVGAGRMSAAAFIEAQTGVPIKECWIDGLV